MQAAALRLRSWRVSAVALAVATISGLAVGGMANPAPASVSNLLRLRASYPVSLHQLGSIASFTPSTKDARLAAVYARAVLDRTSPSFRFTPTSGSVNGRRSVTVLVRAPSLAQQPSANAAAPSLAPLAYSLDMSRGWRKIALPETRRKPLDPVLPDLSGAAGFSLPKGRSASSPGSSGGIGQRALVGDSQSATDLASSYSLTRNIDLSAGVREKDRDRRLTPITDKQQDRQAVFVGTTVKF